MRWMRRRPVRCCAASTTSRTSPTKAKRSPASRPPRGPRTMADVRLDPELLRGWPLPEYGAGKLQIGTCRSVAAHVAIAVPEALVFALDETAEGALAPSAAGAVAEHANAADAVVLGPGFAADEANARLVAEVARRIEVPAVVDAAAMWCLREAEEALAPLRGRVVITPHAGEMADLLNVERGEVERDTVRFA